MEIEPIAYIHTDFPEKFGIPRQSGLAKEARGRIVFVPEYRHPDALRGLTEYDYLWLIWDFSRNHREGWAATVTPPRLGGKERVGVFASRSPFRPNPLGLSCVRLDEVTETEKEGTVISVSGVDLLDGTPIYDIKPYLPYTDAHPNAAAGFSDRTAGRGLAVEISAEMEAEIRPELRDTIRSLLAQDPRTAFIHDDGRIWGMRYAEYNIRFTVHDGILSVCEVGIV